MAKVSVVIPVYNIAAHLEECLDSVVGQSLTDLEILCVDDGSTDESPDILRAYEERDERVRVLTQPNAGPGEARNRGLAAATGEYLIFLDSDDRFEEKFLERMVCRAEETGGDTVICRSVEFDTHSGAERPSDWMVKTHLTPGDVFSPEEAADTLFQFTYGWPWDKLYRTDFIRKNGLRFPPLRNSEDLVFVFSALACSERIALLPEVLVHHRVNRRGSVSNSRHLDPEVPYRAVCLFREELERRGRYERYQRSFLNWAMPFLVWNVANMGEERVQKRYFSKLKREYFPEMGFHRHPADYYWDKAGYGKYLLAKYMPYPVFSLVLSGYHFLKK